MEEQPRNVYWVPVRRKQTNLDMPVGSSSHHHGRPTAATAAASAFATLATTSSSSSTPHTFTRRQVVGSNDLGSNTSTADVMSTVITAVILFIIISTSLLGIFIWRQGRRRRSWQGFDEYATPTPTPQMQEEEGRDYFSSKGSAARFVPTAGYRDAPLLRWNEKSQRYERAGEVVASPLGVDQLLADDHDDDGLFLANPRRHDT